MSAEERAAIEGLLDRNIDALNHHDLATVLANQHPEARLLADGQGRQRGARPAGKADPGTVGRLPRRPVPPRPAHRHRQRRCHRADLHRHPHRTTDNARG